MPLHRCAQRHVGIESSSSWNQHEWPPAYLQFIFTLFFFYLIPTNISPGCVWRWLIKTGAVTLVSWPMRATQRSSVQERWFVVPRRSEDATRSASAGQRSINIPMFDTIGWLNKIKKTRTGRHGRFSVSVFLIIIRMDEKSRIHALLSFGAFVGSFHCPSLLVERRVFLCEFLWIYRKSEKICAKLHRIRRICETYKIPKERCSL